MSRRALSGLAIFFIPIFALTAITQIVQKDSDKDLTNYKKTQPANYQLNKENNAQIMKYIMESTKGDKIDFFSGLEDEMKNIESIKNQNLAKDEERKKQQAAAAVPQQQNNTTTPKK